MKQFDFYIIGMDVWDYTDILIEQNGEESEIIQLLDVNYDRLEKSHSAYADVLLEIRNFLQDHGFERQIKQCDEAFVKKIGNRGNVCPHVPMFERWKMDEKTRLV